MSPDNVMPPSPDSESVKADAPVFDLEGGFEDEIADSVVPEIFIPLSDIVDYLRTEDAELMGTLEALLQEQPDLTAPAEVSLNHMRQLAEAAGERKRMDKIAQRLLALRVAKLAEMRESQDEIAEEPRAS